MQKVSENWYYFPLIYCVFQNQQSYKFNKTINLQGCYLQILYQCYSQSCNELNVSVIECEHKQAGNRKVQTTY